MKMHIAFCFALSHAGIAQAAVSPDEARQLGTTLTEVGAIKSAASDSTIPALKRIEAPADFRADSGKWADPFKDEQPLLKINNANMHEHAERLSDGQKELLRRNPDYYLNVYPSHRTAVMPDHVLKATVRNATGCSTQKDGLALDPVCRGGLPFPIPKNGLEAMWNHQARYRQGDTATVVDLASSWIMDVNGTRTLTSEQSSLNESPYYQLTKDDRDPLALWRGYSLTKAPARRAGEMTGLTDFLDPTTKPRRAWSYTPGQRRVRLAPEFNYDTPVASLGGLVLFDELFLFTGMMDRFDFKLVGRKEMYIPYNSYKLYFVSNPQEKMMAKHVNPEYERWELHRVWVVEATLKDDERHVYSKRIYYFDEDHSGSGMVDAWSHGGDLYRTQFLTGVQLYDKDIPYNVTGMIYDFQKDMYGLLNDVSSSGIEVLDEPMPERMLNPEAVVMRHTQR